MEGGDAEAGDGRLPEKRADRWAENRRAVAKTVTSPGHPEAQPRDLPRSLSSRAQARDLLLAQHPKQKQVLRYAQDDIALP